MRLRTILALATGFVVGVVSTVVLGSEADMAHRPTAPGVPSPEEYSSPDPSDSEITFIGPDDPGVGTERWYEMHAQQVIENNPGIVQDYVEGDELAQKTLLREFIEVTDGIADSDTASAYIDRELFPGDDAE